MALETVTIHCPLPPSVNRLWRNRKDRKAPYLDRRYATWKRVFDSIIMATVPRPKIGGSFIAVITLDRDKLHGNSDIDNRVKALMDALQKTKVIENDKLAESLTVRKGHAPEGCRVTISPYRSVSEQEAA